jgi:hypothetical protein
MHFTINELLAYCFGESSTAMKHRIERGIIFDEEVANLVSQINRLKREHGSKQIVLQQLQPTRNKRRKKRLVSK